MLAFDGLAPRREKEPVPQEVSRGSTPSRNAKFVRSSRIRHRAKQYSQSDRSALIPEVEDIAAGSDRNGSTPEEVGNAKIALDLPVNLTNLRH